MRLLAIPLATGGGRPFASDWLRFMQPAAYSLSRFTEAPRVQCSYIVGCALEDVSCQCQACTSGYVLKSGSNTCTRCTASNPRW